MRVFVYCLLVKKPFISVFQNIAFFLKFTYICLLSRQVFLVLMCQVSFLFFSLSNMISDFLRQILFEGNMQIFVVGTILGFQLINMSCNLCSPWRIKFSFFVQGHIEHFYTGKKSFSVP